MPLMLQIHDSAGKPRPFPNGCGGWHLQIAQDTMAMEAAKLLCEPEINWNRVHGDVEDTDYKEFKRMVRLSNYALDKNLPVTEAITWEDPADGELYTFNPGDRVVMWRS